MRDEGFEMRDPSSPRCRGAPGLVPTCHRCPMCYPGSWQVMSQLPLPLPLLSPAASSCHTVLIPAFSSRFQLVSGTCQRSVPSHSLLLAQCCPLAAAQVWCLGQQSPAQHPGMAVTGILNQVSPLMALEFVIYPRGTGTKERAARFSPHTQGKLFAADS